MIEQVCRKERQYGMKIREIAETKRKAKEWFASYTADYDMEDPKIALKAVHTYHVAELCQTIAESMALNEVECMAAWLSGLLHDVGRFEQIRRFNTFSDADSIDHALLSTEILFGTKEDASCGRIRQVILDPSWDIYLYKAIKYHSAYRLPPDLSEMEKTYCQILRDEEKIDIFRVNLETPMEDIYNTTTETLKQAEVTSEVLQAFKERHAVLRALKKTPVDNVVGHISLYYELVYPKSRQIALSQGYLLRLAEFASENERTRKVFEDIRTQLQEDIENGSKK